MPKLKTNKSAKKRFKISKRRKVLRSKASRRHLLTDKSSKKKRGLRRKAVVTPAMKDKVLKLLPYG
ncbi:MAG: 50S ribosomal protein L35 [Candidatus Omnitrophota bacterium]